MKAAEVLKLLKRDGWYEVTQIGSHKQLKHPHRPGKVTIPMHKAKDIPIGTLKSIFRQAGLKK